VSSPLSKIARLAMFKEIICVYSVNYMKHKYTVREKCTYISVLSHAVHIVSSALYMVNSVKISYFSVLLRRLS
jgi:hypothetical protein